MYSLENIIYNGIHLYNDRFYINSWLYLPRLDIHIQPIINNKHIYENMNINFLFMQSSE